ncbi:hypothetical protein GW17_00016068 [Ensete ventricosum]|nr:hypothetical protein GW17_00016068 [Ensete ventricosum]
MGVFFGFSKHCVEIVMTSLPRFLRKVTCSPLPFIRLLVSVFPSREVHPCASHDKSVACSFVFVGFFLRSKLPLCYDLLGLGDRPNIISVKRVCSLSSIRLSMVSNIVPIRSTVAMV